CSVYQVRFAKTTGLIHKLTADGTGLLPLSPADLVGFTLLVTDGPAKNKTRIITGAQAIDAHDWVLILDRAWFSPFTKDASTPDATGHYTLLKTNPNQLVKEETQANLLFLYDTDNPASYNDPALAAGHSNAFGEGRLFNDSSLFG